MILSKDKNFLEFSRTMGRDSVFYDLNTGVFYFHDRKKRYTRLPPNMDWIFSNDDEIWDNIVYSWYVNDGKKTDLTKPVPKFLLFDKLLSLGYQFNMVDIRQVMLWSDKTITLCANNIPFFACRVKEKPDIRAGTVLRQLQERQALIEYQVPLNHPLADKIVCFVRNYSNYWEQEQRPIIGYWLAHGMVEIYDNDHYQIRMAIRDIINHHILQETTCQRKDWMGQLITARRMKPTDQDEATNRLLAYYQTNKKLEYENDKFIVIVPTTKDEFVAESERQHNCVYTEYLPAVIRGTCNIVFVRDKQAQDKSLVTCEIRKGEIRQYLGQYNRNPDATLNAFRKEYQKYLDSRE